MWCSRSSRIRKEVMQTDKSIDAYTSGLDVANCSWLFGATEITGIVAPGNRKTAIRIRISWPGRVRRGSTLLPACAPPAFFYHPASALFS